MDKEKKGEYSVLYIVSCICFVLAVAIAFTMSGLQMVVWSGMALGAAIWLMLADISGKHGK